MHAAYAWIYHSTCKLRIAAQADNTVVMFLYCITCPLLTSWQSPAEPCKCHKRCVQRGSANRAFKGEAREV